MTLEKFTPISPEEARRRCLENMNNLFIGALNEELSECLACYAGVYTIDFCEIINKMRELFSITAFSDDEIRACLGITEIINGYREVGWIVDSDSNVTFRFSKNKDY